MSTTHLISLPVLALATEAVLRAASDLRYGSPASSYDLVVSVAHDLDIAAGFSRCQALSECLDAFVAEGHTPRQIAHFIAERL